MGWYGNKVNNAPVEQLHEGSKEFHTALGSLQESLQVMKDGGCKVIGLLGHFREDATYVGV